MSGDEIDPSIDAHHEAEYLRRHMEREYPARTNDQPDQPSHADIFREVVRLERALWASAAVVEAARAWARTAPIGSMTTRETELFAAVHALAPTETTTSDRAAHWQQRCKELEAERDAVRSIVESIVYAAPETWPLHLERLAQLVLRERTNG